MYVCVCVCVCVCSQHNLSSVYLEVAQTGNFSQPWCVDKFNMLLKLYIFDIKATLTKLIQWLPNVQLGQVSPLTPQGRILQ